jgi:hypothetical protein
VNVELSIANWYNIFPYENDFLHTLRFGFGIRVFLNVFETIRPYFTHDISSCVLWASDRTDCAKTFGILLGLGIDIPLTGKKRDSGEKGRAESSSLFFDISYNTFSLAYFDPSGEKCSFISASCGYSLLLPGKKKEG